MHKANWILGSFILLAACSKQGGHVKTPDELVADQERLADQQAVESKKYEGTGAAEETDIEEVKHWDQDQAELELKRAARSAATCQGSLSEDQRKGSPRGTGHVTLVFNNEGHVKESSIGSPFADTPVGKCALRAMAAVIVPAYVGAEETVEWEVDLTGKKQKEE